MTEHPSTGADTGDEPEDEYTDSGMGHVILCRACYDGGDWGGMWPGGGHDDEPVWAVAEIETDSQGEWCVTWHETGLTVAQAEEL